MKYPNITSENMIDNPRNVSFMKAKFFIVVFRKSIRTTCYFVSISPIITPIDFVNKFSKMLRCPQEGKLLPLSTIKHPVKIYQWISNS